MPQKKKGTKSQTPVAPSLKGLVTRDNLLHGKLTQDPVPSHKDTRLSDRKSWEPTGKHPAGVSEGAVEQAVKEVLNAGRGNYLRDDAPYLEQYFHPDQDILERQDLRPTVTSGKNENLDYRKLALEHVKEPDIDKKREFYANLDRIAKKHTDPMSKEWTTAFNKGVDAPLKDYSRYNLKGLGNYTEDHSNPNYDSIYDEWDFNTKTPLFKDHIGIGKSTGIIPSIKEYIAKTFMKNAGTPYAVYDRVPKGTANTTRIPLKGLPDKR